MTQEHPDPVAPEDEPNHELPSDTALERDPLQRLAIDELWGRVALRLSVVVAAATALVSLIWDSQLLQRFSARRGSLLLPRACWTASADGACGTWRRPQNQSTSCRHTTTTMLQRGPRRSSAGMNRSFRA